MYLKNILMILGLLASMNLYANGCNIDLISQDGNQYEYKVNTDKVTVIHTKGIANLLVAQDNSTYQVYKGLLKKNQVCLNLSKNCVEVDSDDIKEYIKLFLKGNICRGDNK